MKPRGRQAVVCIDFVDVVRFFSVKDGLWQVRCKGLPEDCRVISATCNNKRGVIEFVLESEGSPYFELAKTQEPPNISLYEEIELLTPKRVSVGW